jgi:1-acyl-sn-glycerol-3-phosphate acyltransferase
MWTERKKNPYADLPITARRIFYTLSTAILYLFQVLSAILLGSLLFGLGKKTDRKREMFHRYICSLYRLDMKFIPGIKCRIGNPYNEQFRKGGIMICNHQSLLDSVCLLVLAPKILIVTNDNVWQNKLIHTILCFADFYPISQGIENSIPVFREYIDKGYFIALFPEGERSQTLSILRFHRGAFYLAEQLKADILPVFIHGVGHVMPKGCAWANKGQILIQIEQRIAPDNTLYGRDYLERTKNIRHYYKRNYEELCRSIETASYFHTYIVDLYGYLGIFKQKKVEKVLNSYADFSAWIDVSYDEETIVILNDEYGVIGLLLALVHPNKQVITTDDNHWLCALRYKCKSLPAHVELSKDMVLGDPLLESSKVLMFKPADGSFADYHKYNPIRIE